MRRKAVIKRIHKPSTKDIFYSLSDMPGWSAIILKEKDESWSGFLQWVLNNYFFIEDENFTIKKMAKDFGADPAKVTKWISEIYTGIFDLNDERPELFRTEGTKHELHAGYFDTNGYVKLWLLNTPRMYEGFTFPFFNAKIGTSWFYVEDVHHTVSKEEHSIRVQLTGGIRNRYRDHLIERAKFDRVIGYSDIMEMGGWELDENLRKWYK